MFLPHGPVKYEPMKVEFVNLEKFFESLSEDLFTGYCEFETGKRIVFLYDMGGLQRVFQIESGVPSIVLPEKAFDECMTSAEEVRGITLPSKVVDMMIRLLFCTPLHQNLSTQFTDFRSLLRSLEGERFTGYVEVGISDRVHYLSMEKGGPRKALYFSGEDLYEGAEALEMIFMDESRERAYINIYPFKEVPLGETFLRLSQGLFARYSELKGPMLAQQLQKKLFSHARETDMAVGIEERAFTLEGFPSDIRKQEEVAVPLLQREIQLLSEELGEKVVHALYAKLIDDVETPLKEIFGGVV